MRGTRAVLRGGRAARRCGGVGEGMLEGVECRRAVASDSKHSPVRASSRERRPGSASGYQTSVTSRPSPARCASSCVSVWGVERGRASVGSSLVVHRIAPRLAAGRHRRRQAASRCSDARLARVVRYGKPYGLQGISARTRVPRARRALDGEAAVRAPPLGRRARAGRCPAPGRRRRCRRRRPRRPLARSSARDRDAHARGVGVLRDVRQRLGHDVERRGLDRGRQPLAGHLRRARPGAAPGRRATRAPGRARGRSAPPGGSRARARAAPRARARARRRPRRGARRAAAGSLVEPRLGEPERQRERDEPLLRAVVQVALEPPALGVARLDDARTRAAQLVLVGGALGDVDAA